MLTFVKKQKEIESEKNPEENPVTAFRINSAITYSNVLVNYTNTGLRYQAGAINCLVVSRTDSNLVLAGSQNGGVWISHNAAHSWQPVNDTARSLCVTSIAQNFFRANEFYYSTGVDITENSHLLFDIYRSVDFGQTFSIVNPVSLPRFGKVSKIIPSPVDGNTLFVIHNNSGISGSGGVVYRTTDNCNNFEAVFASANAIDDLVILPNGTVEIGTYHSVWRSFTGNAGSFVQAAGISSTGYNTRIAFCQSRPDVQYCTVYLFGGYDFYKSLDSGQTWTWISTTAFGHRLAVKPDDPDFVIMGTISITVSLDGGQSWQGSFGGHDLRSFNFDPNRFGKVFITSDFGIKVIEVDPITPSSFNIEYHFDSLLYSQEAYHGDHGASGIQTLQGYQDLGCRYIQSPTQSRYLMAGDGVWTFISKQNPDIGYYADHDGDIYRSDHMTTNVTFTAILNQLDADHNGNVDEGTMFINPFAMNNANDSQLYFPTFTRLWRSLDRGSNWTPVSNNKGNRLTDLTIACTNNPDPIVYWTNSDSVFVMANAATAAPFSEFGRTVPFDPYRSYVDPDHDSALYIISRNTPSRINYCNDIFNPGSVWTDVPLTSLPGVTIQCIAVYPGNDQVIFAGSKEGGLYVTLNRGLTWTKEIGIPNVQITEIKIRESDKKVFIFTYGRGTWTADFALPLSVSSNVNRTGVSVYPNPFNDQLTIDLDRELSNATVVFTDVRGRECMKKSFSGKQFLMRSGELVPGVYLITVSSGGDIIYQTKVVRVAQ